MHEGEPVRVLIVGDSNNIIQRSYARTLQASPSLRVDLLSVGGCPNHSLLYSLAKARHATYDVVLVSPVVAELEWIDLGLHRPDVSAAIFTLFMAEVRRLWPRARVVLILIPRVTDVVTRKGTGLMAQYRALASAHGVELADLAATMDVLLEQRSWLLHLLYRDTLHLSAWASERLAWDLERVILGGMPSADPDPAGPDVAPADDTVAEACDVLFAAPNVLPAEAKAITRSTSLWIERFMTIQAGEQAGFSLPRPHRLLAVVLNHVATSAWLVVRAWAQAGQEATIGKDLRLTRVAADTLVIACNPVNQDCVGVRFEFEVRADGFEAMAGLEVEPTHGILEGPALGVMEIAGAVFVAEDAWDAALVRSATMTRLDDARRLPLDELLREADALGEPSDPDAVLEVVLGALSRGGELPLHRVIERLNMSRYLTQEGRDADGEIGMRLGLHLDTRDAAPEHLAEFAIHEGRMLLDRGEPAAAEAPLRRAATLDPQSSHTWHLLTISLARQGRFAEAIAPAEAALRAEPDNPHLHGALTNVLVTAGQPARARRSIERAVALQPNFAHFRLMHAEVLQNLGEDVLALAELDAVLAREPANPDALSRRAALAAASPPASPEAMLARMPECAGIDAAGVSLRLTPRLCRVLNRHAIFVQSWEPLTPDPSVVLRMGRDVVIEGFCFLPSHTLFTMGAFSYSHSPETNLGLGRYCSVGDHLVVLGERHPVEWVTTSNITYCFEPGWNKPHFLAAHERLLGGRFRPQRPPRMLDPAPVLEHDVWIGRGVQLARGITIGTGAIIAAGSVVTRSVAPYTIVGGNPARVIRLRFDPAIAEGLLDSRWWEHDVSTLFENDFRDPAAFLRSFREKRAAGLLQPCTVARLDWTALVRELAAEPED